MGIITYRTRKMLRVRSYVVTYLGANFLTYRICGIQYVYWALESCLGYLTLAHLLDLVVVMSIHICKLYLKTSVYSFIKIYLRYGGVMLRLLRYMSDVSFATG